MKINGKKLSGPNIEIIVIPRANGDDVVFKAQGILELDDFQKLCPPPKAPTRFVKGNRVADVEDAVYKASVLDYATKKTQWIILQSLRATEGLEWETVNYSDPSTWGNYEKELRDAGFSISEIDHILEAVLSANSLNEDKMKSAREHFLRSMEGDQAK